MARRIPRFIAACWFAAPLPAGGCEIRRMRIREAPFPELRPGRLKVLPGRVTCLGNPHVDVCVGMAARRRGNILGADVSIRDECQRDVALIRQRFASLQESRFDKQLLPDNAWQRRASCETLFRAEAGPFDRGECATSAAKPQVR